MIVKHYTLALNSQFISNCYGDANGTKNSRDVEPNADDNIFKRETDFGLLFAKLTVLGSLASGKACGCRAACRRWEIAPGCPVPL